jgi:ubiquinone/menaquinone biosynthesis C-methylase UbiE
MSQKKYVHGYSSRESVRLTDQAVTLTEFLHRDTTYSSGSKVLESGCGVGAQTVILAQNSPEALITSIDISSKSIDKAKALIGENGIVNVKFQVADIFNLSFEDESYDHIFVCFVLEHLEEPIKALNCLKRVLKKGGTITVIEGDHGSTYFYPESKEAMKTIQCQVDIQAMMKGNSLIGRQIYPLMKSAGFNNIEVSPKTIYVDGSRPSQIEGFTKKTFIAMVEGVKEQAIALNLIDESTWEKGISDLYKTATSNGTFCYTFFKGVAIK